MNDVLVHKDSTLGEEFLSTGQYAEAGGLKKLFKKVGSGLKKDINKAESGLKKDIKKVGNVADTVMQLVLKYNPVLILMRAGFSEGMKLNVVGLATRLYPAIIDENKAIQLKYDKFYIPQAKIAYIKAHKIFVNDLKGTESNLKKDITQGYKMPAISLKTIVQKGAGKQYANKYQSADGSLRDPLLRDSYGNVIFDSSGRYLYDDGTTGDTYSITNITPSYLNPTQEQSGLNPQPPAQQPQTTTGTDKKTSGTDNNVITIIAKALAPLIQALTGTKDKDGKDTKVMTDPKKEPPPIDINLPDGTDLQAITREEIANATGLTPEEKKAALAEYDDKMAASKQTSSGFFSNKWVWIIGGVGLLGIVILIIPKHKHS